MAKTIKIPEGLEQLGDSLEALVKDLSGSIKLAKLHRMPSYGDVEKSVADRAAEIERESHRAMLQALDIDEQAVVIEGARYRRVLREDSTYHCMAGDIVVTRSLYRECGTRGGKTVDPVSLRAGVVGDGWLPLTAQAMAYQLQRGTSRDAEESARQVRRLPYSRSSFERVGHLVGERYATSHAEIEDTLIRAFEVSSEAASVSVSVDRISLPMEELRKRPVGRPRKDAPKNPISRNYRMAWCGTVTFHDVRGEALHTIRYGRMPKDSPVELAQSLVGDVLVTLEQRPDLEVAVLADGAHENWDLLGNAMAEFLPDKEVRQVLDLWHVLEKLGAAARVMHGKKNSGVELARWRLMLLNSKSAAARILKELEISGKEHVQVGESRPVHEAITYLTNHASRMDYASARRAGLPLGSGNVEATCKSLVEMRMKRSGSRWKEHTGAHIMHLRALALSDRWDQAIHLTLEPLVRSVKAAA
jgi:hypothetical protein